LKPAENDSDTNDRTANDQIAAEKFKSLAPALEGEGGG
jgi:hypothetical protein